MWPVLEDIWGSVVSHEEVPLGRCVENTYRQFGVQGNDKELNEEFVCYELLILMLTKLNYN
jgi:hypothetical protein